MVLCGPDVRGNDRQAEGSGLEEDHRETFRVGRGEDENVRSLHVLGDLLLRNIARKSNNTAEGEAVNRFGVHLNPNLFTWNCLTRWTWDGGEGWGEDPERYRAMGLEFPKE